MEPLPLSRQSAQSLATECKEYEFSCQDLARCSIITIFNEMMLNSSCLILLRLKEACSSGNHCLHAGGPVMCIPIQHLQSIWIFCWALWNNQSQTYTNRHSYGTFAQHWSSVADMSASFWDVDIPASSILTTFVLWSYQVLLSSVLPRSWFQFHTPFNAIIESIASWPLSL